MPKTKTPVGRSLNPSEAAQCRAWMEQASTQAASYADVIDPERNGPDSGMPQQGAELRKALDVVMRAAHDVVALLDVGARE